MGVYMQGCSTRGREGSAGQRWGACLPHLEEAAELFHRVVVHVGAGLLLAKPTNTCNIWLVGPITSTLTIAGARCKGGDLDGVVCIGQAKSKRKKWPHVVLSKHL